MRLVGYNDLQGRSAYQPVIKKQGARWIAYVGHHGDEKLNPLTGKMEDNGTSILDVTDPRHPRYLAHIPGLKGKAERGGAQMVRVCSGAELPRGTPGKFYLLRTFGNRGHAIWDVTDPAKPVFLVNVARGLKGTHKNFWECDTGIAYLVSGDPAWRTSRMTKIYDLSDPAHPQFIRNFGLAGQQPDAEGPVPVGLHGMISTGVRGNRVYFGYGTDSDGILQIVDRDKLLHGPRLESAESLMYPEISRLYLMPTNGAHTTFPLLGMDIPEFAKDKGGNPRDFVVITSEAIRKNCQEFRQMVWIADITSETRPLGVSTYTPSESSGHFCSRGGRFGTHSSNESFAPVYYGRIMFFAAFNAGVRAVDVRDPYHPREIGYYIPAMTRETVALQEPPGRAIAPSEESDKRAIQTNNVEVDERGYIYIVDRADTGLHILELTGAARRIADWSQAAK